VGSAREQKTRAIVMKKRRPKSRLAVPKAIDVTKYPGEWLALDPQTHEILGHSRSLPSAIRQAAKKGVARPRMLGVPKSDAFFVGAPHIVKSQ
jgi:hypothetical protein